MRVLLIAAILALPVSYPSASLAHGGGLNAEGCHNNRKTGDYHCHRAGASATAPKRKYGEVSNNVGSAFRNCTAARAAGAAPVYRGEAGYGPHLDRDGDGIGCE